MRGLSLSRWSRAVTNSNFRERFYPFTKSGNNRGDRSRGSEIDPTIHAEYVLHACQWMLADLARYHQLEPAVARQSWPR